MKALEFMQDMKKRCERHFARLGLRITRLSLYDSNGIHYIGVGICMPLSANIIFDTNGIFHIHSSDTTIYHIHHGISKIEANHMPDDDEFLELYFREKFWDPIVDKIYDIGKE
jgi:hypothetical protein